MALYRRY